MWIIKLSPNCQGDILSKDTVVAGLEVVVQHPVDNVFNVLPEWVTDTQVDVVLCHIVIGHGAALWGPQQDRLTIRGNTYVNNGELQTLTHHI